MALNYKIITRKVSDLKGGAKTDKAFATPVYTGYTELEDICKENGNCKLYNNLYVITFS